MGVVVGTTRMVPKSFKDRVENAEIFQVLRVQGISEEWVVFAPLEAQDKRVLVVHAPDGGPMNWMQQWTDNPQTVHTYTYSEDKEYPDAFEAACKFATESAFAAVRAEMSY